MLKVESISKRYGNTYALRDASFSIKQGEIVGLLGRNGAGKSTAMNIITGYISATAGTVELNGYDLLKDPQYVKRNIGYLPEQPPLYADMTVREYLRFAAEIKQVPRNRRKTQADKAMERVQITDHSHRLIKHLSKGYRQRLGVALAMLGDPEILILDEPSIGLDPIQLAQMREVLRELGKEQAVLISSHILHEISGICSRVIILNCGRIVAQDSLQNLLQGEVPCLILRTPLLPGVIETVRSIEGITGVKAVPSPEEDCTDLSIEYDRSYDVRRSLFELFSSLKHPILMLRPVDTALEDVFIHLAENRKEA